MTDHEIKSLVERSISAVKDSGPSSIQTAMLLFIWIELSGIAKHLKAIAEACK